MTNQFKNQFKFKLRKSSQMLGEQSKFTTEENNCKVFKKIKDMIYDLGGYEFINCEWGLFGIILTKKINKTYDKRKDKIVTFKSNKEYVLTEHMILEWIEKEKKIHKEANQTKSRIIDIKNNVIDILKDYSILKLGWVLESEICIVSSCLLSKLLIFKDSSNSILHNPHIPPYGVSMEIILKELKKCEKNELILNEILLKILTDVKGFFTP